MMAQFSSFPEIDLSDESDLTYAVRVENVSFGYNKKIVLNEFSVDIVQGKIFALLGPNGCGKTTILKMVLGRVRPSKGWIRVFDLEPGDKELEIPGPAVGYMPQEIALYNDLTIRECLHYFGQIYQMSSEFIEHRIENLIELLYLPKKEKKINQLSGGQQRLVSMAVTIIHRPKLLILDEPTVGVDSILRCRIWSYLESICEKYGTTVIITTHYIDEAKNANNVGFISYGSLLTQAKPSDLINQFNCNSLEEVFLKLCQQRHQKLKSEAKTWKRITKGPEVVNAIPKTSLTINNSKAKTISTGINLKRIGALFYRNYIRIKRNPLAILCLYVFPIFTLSIFSLTVGSKPIHVPIAVYTGIENSTRQLANKLFAQIDHQLIVPRYYLTNKSAVESVIMGKNMYAFSFPANYSTSLRARLPDPFKINDTILDNSIIKIYADHSDTITAVYTHYLYIPHGVLAYLQEIATEVGLSASAFALPVKQIPLFKGSFYNTETYPSSGILMMLVYILPMVLSSFYIISDVKFNSLERTYVSGVKPIEVFLVHMFLMFGLMSIQVFISIAITYYLFDIPIDSSVLQVYFLLMLQGLEGAGIGLMVALVFKDEVYIFVLVVGILVPLLTISGVIWPSEAIPLEFRLLTDWTPITLPLESLRSLLFRRLTMFDTRVLIGFIVSFFYNLLVFTFDILLVTSLKNFDFLNFFHLT